MDLRGFLRNVRNAYGPDFGLDPTAESHVGRLLEVEPVYGYGWSGAHGAFAEVPSPFRARLLRLVTWREKRMGGIVRIETNLPLDARWMTFSLRHRGHYDFQDRVAHYTVSLYRGDTVPPHETESPPPGESLVAQGYARIRAS